MFCSGQRREPRSRSCPPADPHKRGARARGRPPCSALAPLRLENRVPRQGPRGPPGLGRGSERPAGAPYPLNPGGGERAPRAGPGGCAEGPRPQRAPHPDPALHRLQNPRIWAAQTQATPTRGGARPPSTSHDPHPHANPPRASQRPRRLDRRTLRGSAARGGVPCAHPAAAASSKPAGASPAASAASGRRSPAVGTEDGGAGQRRRGHDPVPGTWPGSREGRSAARRPGRRPGARQPARCPPRLGPDARRLRPAPPEPRGSSSCSGAGARGAGASAAPKLAGEGAMRCARLWAPGPRSGSGERS